MILYFSGTGNSRYVAEVIGRRLGDKVISLNDLLRRGRRSRFTSDKRFVIVCPIYVSRMPLELEQYLMKCRFEGTRDIWFVFTCAGGMGGAWRYCRTLAARKNLIYHGTGCLIMPTNYVVLMNVIPKDQAEEQARLLLPEVIRIADTIAEGGELTSSAKVRRWTHSSDWAEFFHRLLIRDRLFHADSKCIGCGKCAMICPRGDIYMEDGRPHWQGRCMHCMACISACPVKAINYGHLTQKRNRYYLMDEGK